MKTIQTGENTISFSVWKVSGQGHYGTVDVTKLTIFCLQFRESHVIYRLIISLYWVIAEQDN